MPISLNSALYNADVGPSKVAIPAGTAAPTGTSSTSKSTDALLEEFIRLFMNDPGQKRKAKNRNDILMKVAAERVADMAARNYVAHRNLEGHYANFLVRKAGYKLPSWYAADDNNIESIAAGQGTPAEAWNALINHPPHRIHVLGEDAFWAEQVDFGIGHWRGSGSIYANYWLILTART